MSLQPIVRSVDALAWLVERVLAVALIVGISLNFINVVGRYLGGFSLTGVDEIEIYILIWIAFLGAAVVTWRGEHLRMDVLVNACPAPFRKLVQVFEFFVLLAIACFVAWQSYRYVERIYALGSVSDIAHIPTWIPHSAIVVSFALIALIVVLRGAQAVLSRPAQDATRSEPQS